MKVRAFAPATVANVACGFDVLGFALDGVGDRVDVTLDADADGIVIDSIRGSVTDLPYEPERNTATIALAALFAEHPVGGGVRVRIAKGIPLGSGMGGSAASAVAAVVAGAALLPSPPDHDALLRYALEGERVASGAAHADNAGPCLWGGLTAAVGSAPPQLVRIPIPPGILCVLVHPHVQVATLEARRLLPETIPLETHVKQSMALAGFLAACFGGDGPAAGRSMVDLIAQPVRSGGIPGFTALREAAAASGALGFGISGSGPSVFAWCGSDDDARRVERAMVDALHDHGVGADSWVGPISARGARVETS